MNIRILDTFRLSVTIRLKLCLLTCVYTE